MNIIERVEDFQKLYTDFICHNKSKLNSVLHYTLYEATVMEFVEELEKGNAGNIKFGIEVRGEFGKLMCVKLASESLGFLGCLNAGSFSASFHHLRALIELYATIQYCIKYENDPRNWMERFVAFSEIERFKICQEYLKDKEKHDIDSEIIEKYSTHKDYWLELFGIKSNQLTNLWQWYTEVGLRKDQQLSINKMIVDLKDSCALKNYKNACHYVHAGALGSLATMKRITGFPNYINQSIFSAAELFIRCLVPLAKTACITLGKCDATLPVANKLAYELFGDKVKLSTNSR